MHFHRLLEEIHGGRTTVHWAEMTAVTSEIKIMAIAYASSQMHMPYFVSTCGRT